MRNAIHPGGFWRLFDKATAPTSGRALTAEDRLWRKRVCEAAQALSRGDYGPARDILAEG